MRKKKQILQWIKRHRSELGAIAAICLGMYIVISMAYPQGKPLPQQQADSLALRDTIKLFQDSVQITKQALPSPENTIVIPPSQITKVAEVIQETTNVTLQKTDTILMIIKRDSVKTDTVRN